MIPKSKENKLRTARKVPDYLIYEMMDGKPIYYRNYKAVLNKSKTLEEVMGASKFQSVLITYLFKCILKFIDDDLYFVLTNEIGSHIDVGNNISNDIAIFDKKALFEDKIDNHYATIPPKIAIEVDTEADFSEFSETGYVYKKSQKLLDFGVEKIIWVMTDIRRVTVIEKDQDWRIVDWNKDIEIMNGHTFNIGNYLAKEGIQVI